MTSSALLPDPSCLHLLYLEAEPQRITATVRATAAEACCPLCQSCSRRVHSRYARTLADLPWMGWRMRLRLHVRRFFCDNPACERHIFAEGLPNVVAPYARRTLRLCEVLTVIGFALGGEAGKRLCQELALLSSPDTLLRLVHSAPSPCASSPHIIGVDEWSYRRGKQFGTIIVDLQRRMPIELLADRDGDSLANWLKQYPGIELVARDRSGPFADAIRKGAPQATHVADRWHLLSNLGDALEGFFLHKRTAIKEAMKEAGPAEEDPALPEPWRTPLSKEKEALSLQRHQERVERYHTIHELYQKKVDPANIARQVGISRRTVYWYLAMDQPPERKRSRPRKVCVLGPYKSYLVKRWNEGCRNARLMTKELRAQGYTGSENMVGQFLAPFRRKKGQPRTFKQLTPTPDTQVTLADIPKRPPSARQVARWMSLKPEQRTQWQNAYLARLAQRDSSIGQTQELVQAFGDLLRERQGDRLDGWLQRACEQGTAELRCFAVGLKKDYGAVKAGLTLEWSNGQTEGQVHRLKLLKRQAYGRASFQTLRARVLHRS